MITVKNLRDIIKDMDDDKEIVLLCGNRIFDRLSGTFKDSETGNKIVYIEEHNGKRVERKPNMKKGLYGR